LILHLIGAIIKFQKLGVYGLDKRTLLDHVAQSAEERVCLARVLDKADSCDKRNAPAVTPFLTPREQIAAEEVLAAAGIRSRYAFWGGYEGAQRRKLCFLPDWQEEAAPVSGITALRAAYYHENSVTHRDVLGSLMGLGVTRESVGDLLVSPTGTDLLVSDAAAEFLLQNWESAGREALHVKRIAAEELLLPAENVREERATVSSLRLDCLLGAVCHLSRGKAGELIAGGKVQLNWKDSLKADRTVSAGDTITVRGWGKCTLQSVGAPTRKDRVPIVWKRYL
jgi:RNA-binding protein YlmH